MNIYEKFKTDESVEVEGVVLDYGDGVKIRVARAGGANKAYLKAMEKVHRKFKKQLQLDVMNNEVARAVMVEVYAGTVLLSWEGVTDPDGNRLAFTKENAIKVLTDLPDLFSDVREMAENASLFRESIAENDSKN